MVTVRRAKIKGSSFEYDCQYSLSKRFPLIYRTSERGFQRGFDLCDESNSLAFECKRLKGVSWNQLVKIYLNLKKKSDLKLNYLLFQSNRQPCLVFYECDGFFVIKEFFSVFNINFEKHLSTRVS